MDNILFIVFLGIIIFSGIYGYFEILKLKDKEISEKIKLKYYKITILEGWLMVLYVIVVSAISGISLIDIGLSIPNATNFAVSFPVKIIIFVVCGLLFINLLYQIIGFLTSEAFRIQIEKQVEKSEAKENHYNNVLNKIIMPKTYREKLWFALVSATAGIGEELVYRGFLIYQLMRLFPEWSLISIIILAGILFGLAHFYQGVVGIFKTSLFGMVFGVLYIASGSLLAGIILHFTIDLSTNFLRPSIIYTKA